MKISLMPNGPGFSRPLTLSSTPMAELIVDDADLVVHLTLGEKIWSFHGDIRVRLSAIVSVAPDPKPWLGLRGWRMAGITFPGQVALGTRRHGDGYDFCILHRDRPGGPGGRDVGAFQPLHHLRARGRRRRGGGGEDRRLGRDPPLGAGQLAILAAAVSGQACPASLPVRGVRSQSHRVSSTSGTTKPPMP